MDLGQITGINQFNVCLCPDDLKLIIVAGEREQQIRDRRLVEAVLTDLIERGDRRRDDLPSRFSGDFDAISAALGCRGEQDFEKAAFALNPAMDELCSPSYAHDKR